MSEGDLQPAMVEQQRPQLRHLLTLRDRVGRHKADPRQSRAGWRLRVSRSLARAEWIARTSDDQIVSNVTACKLALTTRAHDFLTSTDSEVFLRGARAFTLPEHFHVWRIAATGTAAFMSRAYLKRATAAHAAERWDLSAFRFVQRCGLGASCPRKPPASPA